MSRTVVPERVKRAVANGPVKGYVPAVEIRGDQPVVTLIPQHKAARFNTPDWERTWNREDEPIETPVPHSEIERIRSELPPVIRRAASERYLELIRRLFADAQHSFYQDGVIRWPKSIEAELAVLGVARGKVNLAEQVEALARRFIEKGARQQRAQDSKKTALDWHGHLSA